MLGSPRGLLVKIGSTQRVGPRGAPASIHGRLHQAGFRGIDNLYNERILVHLLDHGEYALINGFSTRCGELDRRIP